MSKKTVNNISIKSNRVKVLEEFAFDYPRDDHYSNGNGVFRFSIITQNLNLNEKEMRAYVHQLLAKLYKMPIIPSRIYINDDSIFDIEVEWEAKDFQVVLDKNQYLKLALQFADYIDEQEIQDFEINTGTFNDDPVFTKYIGTRKINENPVFNNECFGYELIEVLDYSDRKMIAY